ncbi:uncharacterized protein [Polyergus mexicanus]|uniref:uncharacterized protein n=1 Tax=Polyergus mexicanus TaxID=615972 RepID=UPI0038B57A34
MTDSLQGLLIEQSITISLMKRVFPNFKKMGKANVTQYKAKSRLDALETLWERCQRLNVQLQQIATADEQRTVQYFIEEEFFTAEDVYHEAADYLADVIGKFSRCDPNAASTVSDISSRELSGAVSLQLPRIPLPKFSGNFAEWENFRGIFESLVASKESLSNTQKLHYLKASVTGEAAVLINHVKIADANYDGAWKLLIEEYDNQNAIIHAHIHAFADLPIMKTESAVELKSLRDTVAASLAALTNLGRPVEKWDDLLVYIVSQKFSPRTRNEWNLQRGKSTASPTYEEIRDFMTLRIRGLTDHSKLNASSHKNKGSNRASVNNVATEKCLNCSGNHNLMLCDEFKRKSVEQRTQFLKSHKCCFNCLKVGHFPTSCKSKKRCNLCRRAHHTLLHRASNIPVQKISENSVLENKTLNAQPSGSATPEIKNETAVASVQTIHSPLKNPPNVLLATAWVILRTIEGRKFKVRALLDQGSAVSFISESLCQTMRTKRSRASLHVQCFGERYSGVAKSQVSLTLESCNGRGSSTFSLTAFVYQKITSYVGSKTKTVDYWPHLRKLSLADPDPFSNHPIHLLIGSDLYGSLLKQKVKHGPTGTPTAQLTALGWILSGPTGTSNSITGSATSLNCVTIPSLDSLLQKFWEIEEISSGLQLSEEDKKCEQHFIETHQRAEDGRYIIRLPFKTNPPLDIEASRETAALLYSKLEQRLRKNPDLAKPYHSFLNEYKSMGHMESVSDENPTLNHQVYIPHHPVLRESSSTTKLRVVFNASCKTSNGSTLNNHLMTGPKLQRDLSSIILRWRQFRYVYTADIEKMFRQIRVHRDDVDFLRIFWRSNINSPIRSYRLLTVTYGTAPAPYLAMRVINQLAIDEGHSFPKAQTRSSSLLSLYPFLGKGKLIRLGGRIDHSSLSYDKRHPIILPKHRISDLLIAQAHKASLHGGTQLTLRILRQNYWIISARTSVKSLIRSCVKCVRERARTSQQLMGNLPQPRVTPSAPFSHTGVDYAGPMNIIPSVGRGQRSKKYYVAVFICLSTKAVHLEYVDDYATNGFLSAFRRFASRRGLPSDKYSDNGTNFQGADRELNTTFQRLVADPQIQDAIANDNVKWHFIPPSAPHFGGLWEAGVKGLKFHLKRAIGSRTLSQIEFATLLCQIEACLNSRPISALHDDPNDFSALTPGHFLVGRPLVSPPEESVLDIDSNRLSRWQQVRAILEQIWRSWSSDYLHTLQQRRKWQENKPELKINELVLLKNNLAPPSKWELARILDVHPGSDGHVRVVTLRTAKTTLKRPITQICQLPISSDTGS